MRQQHKDVLTQGEWDKIAQANARAEKQPDPAQQTLDISVPTTRPRKADDEA